MEIYVIVKDSLTILIFFLNKSRWISNFYGTSNSIVWNYGT